MVDPRDTVYVYYKQGSPKNSAHISLTNLSQDPLVFKVRSSHPLNFQVKPSMSILSPGEHLKLELSLTPKQQPRDLASSRLQVLCRPYQGEQLEEKGFWEHAEEAAVMRLEVVEYSKESTVQGPAEVVVHFQNEQGQEDQKMVRALTLANKKIKQELGIEGGTILTARNVGAVALIFFGIGYFL